ncbi:MAG: hypothetical protein A3E87_03865 [Gammaproteobacteria bacterium RIFCSPHIGHO2_12_FULL_35_23]|nr:MAG: hypothetical protein A3E87_03865 [Gammaproteobacteria bacterium RIFCSPHIGHO2_12_FULL_35_23]
MRTDQAETLEILGIWDALRSAWGGGMVGLLRVAGLPDKQADILLSEPGLVEAAKRVGNNTELEQMFTAASSLVRVIYEEMNLYLQSLANPDTVEKLHLFCRLSFSLKREGINAIWEQIKDKVLAKLDPEYKYGLEDWVETRKIMANLKLQEHIQCFRREIMNSLGYKKFCRKFLFSKVGLFSGSLVTEPEAITAQKIPLSSSRKF